MDMGWSDFSTTGRGRACTAVAPAASAEWPAEEEEEQGGEEEGGAGGVSGGVIGIVIEGGGGGGCGGGGGGVVGGSFRDSALHAVVAWARHITLETSQAWAQAALHSTHQGL